MQIIDSTRSKDNDCKYLLSDGDLSKSIEATYFRHGPDRAPYLCISSQFGCAVGCVFCETGKQKPLGNMSAAQIVDQVKACRSELISNQSIDRLNTVLFAGMGEPMLNIGQVVQAARTIKEQDLAERVTVTSIGILSAFDVLSQAPIDTLSLSLHATTDETRHRLIPASKNTHIRDLMARVRRYKYESGAHIIVNYLLLDGINDSDADLTHLCDMIEPEFATVKLKYLNSVSPTTGFALHPSSRFSLFEQQLRERNYMCIIDVSAGVDVLGGCGQLRSKSRVLRQFKPGPTPASP